MVLLDTRALRSNFIENELVTGILLTNIMQNQLTMEESHTQGTHNMRVVNSTASIMRFNQGDLVEDQNYLVKLEDGGIAPCYGGRYIKGILTFYQNLDGPAIKISITELFYNHLNIPIDDMVGSDGLISLQFFSSNQDPVTIKAEVLEYQPGNFITILPDGGLIRRI